MLSYDNPALLRRSVAALRGALVEHIALLSGRDIPSEPQYRWYCRKCRTEGVTKKSGDNLLRGVSRHHAVKNGCHCKFDPGMVTVRLTGSACKA